MKRIKKGFTLVELLVVIAIIAILSAVSIVGFVKFNQSAKESNDISMIHQMNLILQGNEVKDGKNKTYTEAKVELVEAGISIDKLINPQSKDYKYGWCLSTNRMVLINEKDEIIEPTGNKGAIEQKWNYYIPVKSEADITKNDGYSVYLCDGFEASGALNIKAGIDTGNNEGISINLVSDKEMEISINTHSADKLTIDALNASIEHYGELNSLEVNKVAQHSYHEYGKVIGTATVKQGKIVFENGSSVASVIVEKVEGQTLTLTQQPKAEVKTVVAGNEASVEVINNSNSIPQEVKVTEVLTDTQKATMSKFAGGLGTEASPYLIATEEQFYNMGSLDSTKDKYFKLVNDLKITEYNYEYRGFFKSPILEFYGIFDGDNYSIELLNCNKDYYYGLFADIYNCTIKNIKYINAKYPMICDINGEVLIDNVDIYGEFEVDGNTGAYVIYSWGLKDSNGMRTSNFTFNNCNSYVSLNGPGEVNYNAIFVGYAGYGSNTMTYHTFNFINCTNEGSLVCGQASMFIGNVPSPSNIDLTLNIKNCYNNGIIQATNSNYQYSQVISSNSNSSNNRVNLTTGDVTITYQNTASDHQLNKVAIPGTGTYVVGPNDPTLKLEKNSDGVFTITQSSNQNVAYYELSIKVYTLIKNDRGTQVVEVSEIISANAFVDGKATSKYLKYAGFVDQEWVDAHPDAVKSTLIEANEDIKQPEVVIYSLNGNIYYFINTDISTLNGEVKLPQIIGVSAYDANGKLLASAGLTNN